MQKWQPTFTSTKHKRASSATKSTPYYHPLLFVAVIDLLQLACLYINQVYPAGIDADEGFSRILGYRDASHLQLGYHCPLANLFPRWKVVDVHLGLAHCK